MVLLLREVRNFGDLSKVSDNDLAELSRRLTEADYVCRQIKDRHRQRQPSAAWLLLSVAQTVASLVMTPVDPAALVVAAGGILGAAKAIYDFNTHHGEASAYFALHWQVDRLRLEIDSMRKQRPTA